MTKEGTRASEKPQAAPPFRDAADVRYALQTFFPDALRSGALPFWMPYVASGYRTHCQNRAER